MWQNAEGIPHFANKSVAWKWLDARLRQGRAAYLFYDNDDGRFMVDLLAGVSEVVAEGEFGWANQAPYRADILLRRGNEHSVAIEIVHTHPPEHPKLLEAARLGIDVYEVEGGYPPFSKRGLQVLKAHIAPANRQSHWDLNSRIVGLYEAIADPLSLDDGFIRVVKNWRGSLDAHDRTKREASEAMLAEFSDLRNEIRQQHVFCLRCKRQNHLIDGGKGFQHSSTLVHRQNGGCGYTHLCRKCEFEIRGGWDRVSPKDASNWWPKDDCPNCQSAIKAENNEPRIRFMPGPVGYVVNGRTVRREDFMGLLVLLNFTAVIAGELLKQAGATARKVDEFLTVTGGAVSQMEEAVHSGTSDPNDVAIRPAGVFGGILPPCPLMLAKREGAFG